MPIDNMAYGFAIFCCICDSVCCLTVAFDGSTEGAELVEDELSSEELSESESDSELEDSEPVSESEDDSVSEFELGSSLTGLLVGWLTARAFCDVCTFGTKAGGSVVRFTRLEGDKTSAAVSKSGRIKGRARRTFVCNLALV